MRPFGRLLWVSAVILLGWWSATVHAADWDLPSGFPDGNLHVETLREFAADLSRRTDGQVTPRVRAANGPGGAENIFSDVRSGRVPIGEVLASSLTGTSPLFAIDSVPFLATDYPGAQRLYQAVKPHFQAILARQGVELLYAVPWPPQGLFADRPLESAQALRGLSFRTYNAATLRLAEMLGAAPRPMDSRHLEAALARKEVQAMITSAATGVDVKAWRWFTLFYDVRAALPFNLVIANQTAVRSLTEAQRSALYAAAQQAEHHGWQLSAARHASQLARLTAHGMSVLPPPPQLAEDLKVLGAALAQEWIRQAGPEAVTIFNEVAR